MAETKLTLDQVDTDALRKKLQDDIDKMKEDPSNILMEKTAVDGAGCCEHLENGRCNFLDLPAEAKVTDKGVLCSRQLPVDRPDCQIPTLKGQSFTRGYVQLKMMNDAAVSVANSVARKNGCNLCNLGPSGPTCKAVGGDPCLHPEKAEDCTVFNAMKARGFTTSGPRDQIEVQDLYDKELSLAQGKEIKRSNPAVFTTLGRTRG